MHLEVEVEEEEEEEEDEDEDEEDGHSRNDGFVDEKTSLRKNDLEPIRYFLFCKTALFLLLADLRFFSVSH
jgi:hypothetical protein